MIVERSLEFAGSPWAIAALALVFAAALALLRRHRRGESPLHGRRLRPLLLGLRAAALGAALLLLARPGIRETEVESARPRVALLVDASASVSDPDALRAEAGRAAAALAPARDVETIPFDGAAAAAIDLAAARLREDGGAPGASIVCVTDAVGFAAARSADVPVVALAVPSRTERLALVAPDAPERVLRGDPLSVSVRVVARGLSGRGVALDLVSGERTLATRRVEIGSDRFDERIALAAGGLPPGLARLALVATADGAADRLDLAVDVVDEKIRVLYVEGDARWTYRFLVGALVRDPAIALSALLLSADPDFPQEASPGVARLERFPSWDELAAFDVVIAGDVDPAALGSPLAAADLRRFVEEKGGGVFLLAGPKSAPTRFRGTPLEDLVPVAIPEDAPAWAEADAPFALALTPEGRTSGVLALVEDPERNAAFLEGRSEPLAERPPGFRGRARTGAAKAGATVLAANPSDGAPLLATQWFGRGRVFFSAIDEFWRWRFAAEDALFHRFFGQAIRAVADVERLGSGGRFRAERRDYRPGETVRLSFVSRDGAPPEGVEVTSGLGEVEVKRVACAEGRAEFVAGAPGLHVVSAVGAAGKASAFRVSEPPLERLADPEVDSLRRYAESTGGSLVASADEVAARLPAAAPERRVDRGTTPLASLPWTVLALLFLLSAEWTLRRWMRLA